MFFILPSVQGFASRVARLLRPRRPPRGGSTLGYYCVALSGSEFLGLSARQIPIFIKISTQTLGHMCPKPAVFSGLSYACCNQVPPYYRFAGGSSFQPERYSDRTDFLSPFRVPWYSGCLCPIPRISQEMPLLHLNVLYQLFPGVLRGSRLTWSSTSQL